MKKQYSKEEFMDDMDMSEEEFDLMAQLFGNMADEDPNKEEAYQYLEKANHAHSSKDAIKYAEKALELCPDLFEAKIFLLTFESNPLKVLDMLEDAVNKERVRLKKADMLSTNPKFLNVHLMPYIHGIYNLSFLYASAGMIQKALELARETVSIDVNGITDGRYLLMGLYAYLEDGANLKKHYKKIGEENLHSLLPMLIYYFKQCNYKEADKYLGKIKKCNKHFEKIFDCDVVEEDDLMMDARPGSKEEVFLVYANYEFLLHSVPLLEAFVKKEKL